MRRNRNRNRNNRNNVHVNNNQNNNNNNNNENGAENFHNLNVAAMLDELERNPFGMGRGIWLIDSTFIFAFFGMVVAIYLLIEESDERHGITPEIKRERRLKFHHHMRHGF